MAGRSESRATPGFTRLLFSLGLPLALAVYSVHVVSVPLLYLALTALLLMMAFNWSRFDRWLLLCAAMMFALLVAEMVSDLLVRTDDDGRRLVSNHYRLYDFQQQRYGAVPREGVYQAMSMAGDETIYDVRYSFGPDGFRLTPGQPAGSSDTRINFFGGSYTLGEGLEDNETLPFYVSQLLPGRDIRNYGMHGWGPHNALALLESGEVRGSVNVLLTFAHHATRAACDRDWIAKHPSYWVQADGSLIYQGFCGQFLSVQLVRFLSLSKFFSRFLVYPSVNQAHLELYTAIISEMQRISTENDQKLVVLFLRRDDKELTDGLSDEKFLAEIKSIADLTVDVTPPTDPNGEALLEYRLHETDSHPSALANQHRAKQVAPLLEKL